TNIVNPIRSLLRRIRFFAGAAEAIDLPNRRVVVVHGAEHHRHELAYDHLVLALGATANYFGTPGLAERALTLKFLGDAVNLRNQLIGNLEEADFEGCRGGRAAPAAVRPDAGRLKAGGRAFPGREASARRGRQRAPFRP